MKYGGGEELIRPVVLSVRPIATEYDGGRSVIVLRPAL